MQHTLKLALCEPSSIPSPSLTVIILEHFSLLSWKPCIPSSVFIMPNRFEPKSYQDLFQMTEFRECRELFFWASWNPFLHSLQGYDEEISFLFAMGFNGRTATTGHLSFQVTKESIAHPTKIPREGERWHKHWFIPWASHNFSLKLEFWYFTGIKGYHHSCIKPKYIKPLTIIIHLVTCDGKFSVFKSCHLQSVSHFVNNRCLNFPFFFHHSL